MIAETRALLFGLPSWEGNTAMHRSNPPSSESERDATAEQHFFILAPLLGALGVLGLPALYFVARQGGVVPVLLVLMLPLIVAAVFALEAAINAALTKAERTRASDASPSETRPAEPEQLAAVLADAKRRGRKVELNPEIPPKMRQLVLEMANALGVEVIGDEAETLHPISVGREQCAGAVSAARASVVKPPRHH